MDLKETLGLAAVITGIASYVPYFFGIARGTCKPHVFSWGMWSLNALIVVIAQFLEGAGPGAWTMGITFICCGIVCVLALFRGEKNITRSDWVCLVIGLMALPLWYLTDDPTGALILIFIVDIVSYAPTFRKSWSKPQEEAALTYLLCAIKYILAIMAIENYNFATVFSCAYIIVFEVGMVITLLLRRRILAAAPAVT
ncbi:MAG: hypothetical protein GC131_05255 [Alphaproteobacteria bacterium]|nr:hypothetical protein [Alphaproteobacteria bacterium]